MRYRMWIVAWALTYLDSGAWAWQDRIANGFAKAVAIDSAGDVTAVGQVDSQFTVTKSSGADGTQLWRQSLIGFVQARGVALNPAGDVFVAGDTNSRFTVIKFSGIDGTELWRQVVDNFGLGGFATAVAVDRRGDAVATGSIRDPFLGGAYTVIKFSGTDGTQLWHSIINGSPDLPGFDAAESVAVNSAGNVASAGIVDTDRLSTRKSDGRCAIGRRKGRFSCCSRLVGDQAQRSRWN